MPKEPEILRGMAGKNRIAGFLEAGRERIRAGAYYSGKGVTRGGKSWRVKGYANLERVDGRTDAVVGVQGGLTW